MRKKNKILIIVILFTFYVCVQCYRWNVLDDDVDTCNAQTCGSRPHSSCLPIKPDPGTNCREFKELIMNPSNIELILLGHNGLRNKVAKSSVPASRMNILHWDKDLARMAQGWLATCQLKKDDCDFIYNNSFSVGQNIFYAQHYPHASWATRAIREWYLEGNYIDPTIIDNMPAIGGTNYTQLMWGQTEFVGCAAARMFGGFLMVCNYHPKGNIAGEPVYRQGKPCTDCVHYRPTCSRIFRGLCGFDNPATGNTISPSHLLAGFLLFVVFKFWTFE